MIHTVTLIRNWDFIGFLQSNKQRVCNNLRFKNNMLWKFWRIIIQIFSNKCLIDVTRSWQRNKNWRNSSSPIYIQSFPWIEYNIKNRIYALACMDDLLMAVYTIYIGLFKNIPLWPWDFPQPSRCPEGSLSPSMEAVSLSCVLVVCCVFVLVTNYVCVYFPPHWFAYKRRFYILSHLSLLE